VIRAAERSDLPRVLSLLEALNQEGQQADARYRARPEAARAMAEAAAASWFDRRQRFSGCLVAEAGDPASGLAGFLAAVPEPGHPWLAQPPTARIDALYVGPGQRRLGLGSALVQELRRRAAAAGYHRLEVHTLARDARALGFWRAQGFADLRVTLSAEPAVTGTGR
jgi:GNAT superfamily N-acetyltransferase